MTIKVKKYEYVNKNNLNYIFPFIPKDEASFHLTNEGRHAIQMHIGSSGRSASRDGSIWLSEIGWRDMWAMVAKHHNYNLEADSDTSSIGGRVYGESYSRNPGLIIQHNSKNTATTSLWGTDVLLRVQVPLAVNHNKKNQSKYTYIIAILQ